MSLFLVDECLPLDVTLALRAAGHDATDVFERELRGIPDRELWALAAAEHRILVTRDLDFPLQIDGPRPVGLILIRGPDTLVATQIGALVGQFLASTPASELADAIVVLSPGRYRRRPWLSTNG